MTRKGYHDRHSGTIFSRNSAPENPLWNYEPKPMSRVVRVFLVLAFLAVVGGVMAAVAR